MASELSLASPSDLCTRLGVGTPGEDTAEYKQLEALLNDASGEIRATIGQPLVKMTSEVALFPDGHTNRKSYVDLPSVPVVSVEGVKVEGLALLPDDFRVRYRTLWLPRVNDDDEIAVMYTHGWEPIPEELVKWTCVLAAAVSAAADSSGALGITAGVSQHTQSIDDYSETWANYGAASNPVGLSLPTGVADRLRALYGIGGITSVSFR